MTILVKDGSGANQTVKTIDDLVSGGLNVVVTNSNPNGSTTSSNSTPVVIANDQAAVATQGSRAATGTQTNVVSTTGSVTLLASNTSRLGAMVFNNSTSPLYVLLKTGGTVSTTAFTNQIASSGYYEVPFGFTGALIGIWSSANGTACVTELTA
jgi:hypothetical protein